MTTIAEWSQYQKYLKSINLQKIFAQKKEKEIENGMYENISLYYKTKIQAELLTNKNIHMLGLLNDEKPILKDKCKLEVDYNDLNLNYYISIKNYLFELRNNCSLLQAFINTLTLEEEKIISKIFINYFFEDLSSCSSSLQSFIFYLLEQHISQTVDFVDDDIYLSKNSFIGRFLYKISTRNEVKIYLNQLFNSILLDINSRNTGDNFLTLDYKQICNINLKRQTEFTSSNGNTYNIINLPNLKRASTGNIVYNKSIPTNIFQSMPINYDRIINYEKSKLNRSDLFKQDDSNNTNKSSISDNNNNIYNKIFDDNNDTTNTYLRSKFKNENDITKKMFYLKNLNNIQDNKHKDIYSFCKIKDNISKNGNTSEETLNILYSNYCYFQEIIIKILDRIYSFNNFCPKIIRFVCNTIYTLIKKKFPHLDNFNIMLYVNKFYFEVILIPYIQTPETNELFAKENILDCKTHCSLNIISNILKKFSEYSLFDNEDDKVSYYTILNNFICNNIIKVENIISKLLFEQNKNIFTDNNNENVYQTICLNKLELSIFLKKYNSLVNYLNNENKYFQMNEYYNNNDINMTQDNTKLIYHLFINKNFSDERLRVLNIDEKKEKISKISNSTFLFENKICIEKILTNIPNLEEYISTDMDFKTLLLQINEYINYKELNYLNPLSNILETNFYFSNETLPLSWYCSYLINNIDNLDEYYTKNNYAALLKFLNEKGNEMKSKYDNKVFLLNNKMTEEFNGLISQINSTKFHLDMANKMELTVFAFYILNTVKLNICVMNGKDRLRIMTQCGTIDQTTDYKTKVIILSNQNECLHNLYNVGLFSTKKVDSSQHPSTIQGFTERILEYKSDISFDIYNNYIDSNKIKAVQKDDQTFANKRIIEFFDYITLVLKNNEKYYKLLLPSEDVNKYEKVSQMIKSSVIKNICNEIESYPALKEKNKLFNIKCREYQFIDPIKHLKIKKDMLSQDQIDIVLYCLYSIDNEKSCYKTLELISTCIDVIQKMINFSSGKEDIGVDDFMQILVYLIIKSKPKYLITRLANCKYFLKEMIENEKCGFDLANLEVAVQFIFNATYDKFGVDSFEEFNLLKSHSLFDNP